MSRSRIEWLARPGTLPESWNMIGGCTKVQPECANCYAVRDSWRIMHNPKHPARYDGVAEMGLTGTPRWTGEINVDWDALEEPRHWDKPRTVFVASMADLFHEDVDDGLIDAVFEVISDTPQHTYLVLTKRSERMVGYWRACFGMGWQWPANCWAGVSAGMQTTLVPHLANLAQLHGPPVKFVSAEPLLEPLYVRSEWQRCPLCGETPSTPDAEARWRKSWDGWEHQHTYPIGHMPTDPAFNWLLIGGETGKRAREMVLEWVRQLLACQDLGIAVFVKQLGEVYAREHGLRDRKGSDPSEWPGDVRMREWPEDA